MGKVLEPSQNIERSIMKKYRKELWNPFIKAVKNYELVQENDKIAVCISGGKDSMLMAKLFQELKRHGQQNFEVVYLVMNPGYNPFNYQVILDNAQFLNVPITVFESEIFDIVASEEQSPCYLCARMRRGYLYSKAKELGCVNTHFVNPHGLHNKKHYTCAHDMALIAQAAFQIPLFRKITKTVEYKIPKTKYMKEDRWLVNHQKMLYEDGEFTYKNCEGGKTGFTDEAWNTLVTYAKKDGKTLVCVELRVNGSWKTFNESAELLDYGFDKFRHEEVDAALDTTTLGQLAGICHFGTASVLDQKEAGIRAVEGKSTVSVTIPKKLKTDKLKRGFCDGNKIVYSYQGWEVGEETLKFNNPAFEVTKTEISDATLQGQTDTNGSETETAGSTEAPEKDASGSKGFEEKVDEFMDNITFGFLNIWTSFNGWVDQHEMLSATVGMILILLMIPLIVIAYMRDKNDKLARKEREQDKEQRRKIEENIDSKSFQEIESEIRSELEKEERRKREAEEEEKRLREMEELIDRQKAKEAQETKETKEIKPTEKPEEEILPAEQPKTEDLKKEEED